MALIFAEHVAQITRTAGTGAYALGVPVLGQYLVSKFMADGDTAYFKVSDTVRTEILLATFTGPATLARTTIISSSNADAAVDWPTTGQRIVTMIRSPDSSLSSNTDFVGSRFRFGGLSYPYDYVPGVDNNTYIVVDREDFLSDASIVFRDRGNARIELGLLGDATEANSLNFHLKLVTGTYLSETFTDRLIILQGASADFTNGALRVFADSDFPVPMLVLGSANGKFFPDATGEGLEISFSTLSQIARFTSITHDQFYRDIAFEANNLRFFTGAVFLVDVGRFTTAGGFVLGAPIQKASGAKTSNGGIAGLSLISGYVLGETLTAVGGTGGAPTFNVVGWAAEILTIVAGGTGGTNGTQTITGTTGTGTMFQASVTVAGGVMTAILGLTIFGNYTVQPTNPANEPVTGGGLTGAAVHVYLAPLLTVNSVGTLTVIPVTPVSTTSSGSGVGVILDIAYQNALGSIDATDYFADGDQGVTGTYSSGGHNITIKKGIITGFT